MDEALFRRMLPVFLAEAGECLAAMEHAIDRLAADAFDREARDHMARGAHTIRGNAASLGLRVMTDHALRLERWALLPPTESPDWMIAELRLACAGLRGMLGEIAAECPVDA